MLAGKVLGLWGVGPLTTDPAKPQTCTHMSGYTQNRMTPQGAHLPSCPRPAVWWLPWAPWADSPTCVCVCVSLPGLGDGVGREGQGPSGLLSPSPPPGRYHPGLGLGSPSSGACYPEGGPRLPGRSSTAVPDSLLTQLLQRRWKRGAPASRGQQDPLTHGRNQASLLSSQ